MNAKELREYLLKYIPEEESGKAEYYRLLAEGKIPDEEIPEFHIDTDSYDDTYFRDGSGGNIAVHRHWRYFHNSYHSHSYVEIMYMFSGSGLNSVEGVVTQMSEGDICVMPHNVFHIFEVNGDGVLVNIIVRPRFLEYLFTEKFPFPSKTGDFFRSVCTGNSYPKCMYIKSYEDSDTSVCEYLSQLLCTYYDSGVCSQTEEESWLTLAFAKIISGDESTVHISDLMCAKNLPIVPILTHIRNNYTQITLDILAEKFNYTKSYICRLIKSQTGKTFSEHVTDMRLSRACELLRCSDAAVSSIAYEIGYNSIEYFNRCFKQNKKVSPTEYRNILNKPNGKR